MSKIEWTEKTWNPVTGCTPASKGCDHCYAARHFKRFNKRPFSEVMFHPERLNIPLRRRKATMYFVNSMSDLFHRDVPHEFLLTVWVTMKYCFQHTFQVLTKRPQRMRDFAKRFLDNNKLGITDPFPNVWLGTTVESGSYTKRIDVLREVPAAVRFISFEPLLGPIGKVNLDGIHWVIVGGESGPGARPMHPDWAREIRDQCQEQGVAFFFKQWGEFLPVITVGDDADPSGRSAMAYDDGTIETQWEPGPHCVNAQQMWRVGKKKAGSLLDGLEHKEYPKVAK